MLNIFFQDNFFILPHPITQNQLPITDPVTVTRQQLLDDQRPSRNYDVTTTTQQPDCHDDGEVEALDLSPTSTQQQRLVSDFTVQNIIHSPLISLFRRHGNRHGDDVVGGGGKGSAFRPVTRSNAFDLGNPEEDVCDVIKNNKGEFILNLIRKKIVGMDGFYELSFAAFCSFYYHLKHNIF